MKVRQTHDGFFQADFCGAPKRRTKDAAQADADFVSPPRPMDRSDKIVVRAILILAAAVVWFFAFGFWGL